MSGSRRIPISNRHPPGQQGGRQPAGFPSSLDLVFSFSRSQAMYQENVHGSSPSFVARYRRPGHPEDDESAASREGSIAATDDEDRWSEGDEDEVDQDEINSWDPAVQDPPFLREQLPKNAVRKLSTASRTAKPSSQQGISPSHLRLSSSELQTERTPLLRDALALPPPSSGRTESHPRERRKSRRLSTYSAQEWDTALEEHRGESTWGQTLFNTVNVLVSPRLAPLLSEPHLADDPSPSHPRLELDCWQSRWRLRRLGGCSAASSCCSAPVSPTVCTPVPLPSRLLSEHCWPDVVTPVG